MDKSPDAFRTISEVAETLETPAHVLRFWESRFPQIRPVKRAGGRRYYRPADVALLTGIKHLLHEEGLTIRGVQKILREQGVRHVAGLSGEDYVEPVNLDEEAALEAALTLNFGPLETAELAPEKATSATVVVLETALRRQEPAKPAQKPVQPVMPDLFANLPAADATPDSAQGKPKPQLSLLDRLRALPAHALAQSDLAAQLHLRLQALHQQMQAGKDHAATPR
ncbi:MerR family transcriptional regulator [Cypionkella sp.]|uniref:MerR family transcriptional regulator n=1 Tax=Cypionkella sp. TaxID=2811411 RepID=UPI003751A833